MLQKQEQTFFGFFLFGFFVNLLYGNPFKAGADVIS